MKINWKVRFKNKVWLLTFIGAIVAFAYQVCTLLGVVPKVAVSYTHLTLPTTPYV